MKDKMQIMIVDDDPNIAQLVKLYLEKDGYDTAVYGRGDEALAAFRQNPPSLMILDIMLPGMDGWQVCRAVRQISQIPIIMLTAKEETFDKVLGLELGADDYMTKPFEGKELLARVKAVLRRAQADGLTAAEVTAFQALPGSGLQAVLDGQKLCGGNADFIRTAAALPDVVSVRAEQLAEEGKTPLFFARGGKLLGAIAVADVLKPDSPQAIRALQNMGIRVVMLTGDNARTAKAIGAQAGVDEVIAGVLPDGKEAEKGVELDDRLLATPVIALAEADKLARKMAGEAVEGFRLALDSIRHYDASDAERIRKIESDTDHYEDILGTYLTKLSRYQVGEDDSAQVTKLLKAIGDFERISDHSVNVLESAEELRAKKIAFSAEAQRELSVLCAALSEVLDMTLTAFVRGDAEAAYDVEPLEQVVDGLKNALRDSHIVRLKNGDCTVEAGFVWADLLTNLERTSDHCSNIAVCLLDAERHDMNAHESMRAIKGDNEAFLKKYREYAEKYSLV